ncbi:MAG: DUF5131 family protein [Ruminococcus sp.]|nr:DUF5131 family protein [Ruminococcus sp.]
MDKTKIEWCDASWNPITGCYHGCEYCYARKMAKRFGESANCYTVDGNHIKFGVCDDKPIYEIDRKLNTPYPFGFTPTLHRHKLSQPIKWTRPRTIFVCSMADLFGQWVPDRWIELVFDFCASAPQHRYLFLTKNPDRYVSLAQRKMLPTGENFWYGSTITDADTPYFFDRSKNKEYNTFISAEPLLKDTGYGECHSDWLILGAETGNRKGKVVPEKTWIDNICYAADIERIPVFMKDSLIPIVGEENMRREFPWR